MNKINIFWGSDELFAEAIKDLKDCDFLINIIEKIKKILVDGVSSDETDNPMDVQNLIVHTDDYGSINEWAILGFTNNVLRNPRIIVHNLWLCNPPLQIYHDIYRNFGNELIEEKFTEYPKIELSSLKKFASEFNSNIIGQTQIVHPILSSIYGLRNPNRKRPVTLLFLGDSGIGKTATAKYLSECIGKEMVRIQFSMQQTTSAYQYIFGAEHGEDSLARALIRRSSNVILLDEFDKVPSSFYNAFYQMFDEGIFEDSNYSVDVSKCIIICTTNYGNANEAEKQLGSPIFSRFSKIIQFFPLCIDDKLLIAENCYKNIMQNIEEEDQILVKENGVLNFFQEHIKNGLYSNIRMLKNDIEDAINYEILKKRGII